MENNIYKLSKYVLKRFEENANDEGGLEILYNTRTNEYWMGNVASKYLINNINGINTIKDILTELSKNVFSNFTIDEIKDSFYTIIEELETKKYIEKL